MVSSQPTRFNRFDTPMAIPGADYTVRKPSITLHGVPYARGEVLPADEVEALGMVRLQRLVEAGYIEPTVLVKHKATDPASALAAVAKLDAQLNQSQSAQSASQQRPSKR